nr:MAG: response regulator [Leptolyngbya sp. IPPAS B-1204]
MLLTNEFLLNPRILEDVQILVVENDCDSRELYAILLENQGATVTTSGSIQDALSFLDWGVPDLLICEIRFLGESVYPLLQRIKSLRITGRTIPILVTSTCSPISLTQQLMVKVEAYLLKPIDIDDFVHQVWDLLLPSVRLVRKSEIVSSSC